MGTYLNPGNSGFTRIKSRQYIDKTGLIGVLNRTINTTDNLVCVSRPRRFGKSYAAQMLCAYYDKSCRSDELFAGCEITKDPTYPEHLNKYDVIYLDMTNLLGKTSPDQLIEYIQKQVIQEIRSVYPDAQSADALDETLINATLHTGNKFIALIDEWDAPIRETPEIEEEYLRFLRMLFKGSGTTARIFAAAYMTGILPIKKDGSQSAISDFHEYTMLAPGEFGRFIGFTEAEVRSICEEGGLSFENMRAWYDGYSAGTERSIYNPYSVMMAAKDKAFRSYWKKTSAAEALKTYIDMDEDGLQDVIARLIAGETVEVDTDAFQNDLTTFTSRDDVLTLMIHLGYLTYEEDRDAYGEDGGDIPAGFARIPNREVRLEFENILRKAKHKELIQLVRDSDQLLKDTLEGREEAVAGAFSRIRETEYAPAYYNNEQALRYIIKFAYISSVDQYARLEELPTGRGLADIVFVPKKRSVLPAMIIELKWSKSAEGAINQIYEKKYPSALKGYGGSIVLVGINYDQKTKEHSCRIETV